MRRSLLLVLLCACREDASMALPDAATPRATPRAAPADDLVPDAPPEPEVAPTPLAILSGQQAEQAIVQDIATPAPPPSPDEPAWVVGPTRLGRVRLGASRGELVMALAEFPRPRQRWVKIPQPGARAGPMAPPSLELAEALDPRGIRMFRFRLLGGRVALAATGYADPQIVTDAGIGIGSTLEAAIEAHGDPRPLAITIAGERVAGVVLEDLPGVVLQVTPGTPQKPAAIFGIVVIGPESD